MRQDGYILTISVRCFSENIFLKISSGVDFTASLDNLFQCFTPL